MGEKVLHQPTKDHGGGSAPLVHGNGDHLGDNAPLCPKNKGLWMSMEAHICL